MFGCVETPKGLNKAIIVHTSIGCDPRTMHRRAGHCRAHRVAEVIETGHQFTPSQSRRLWCPRER